MTRRREGETESRAAEGGRDHLWIDPEEAPAALPTVFRKALERGLSG